MTQEIMIQPALKCEFLANCQNPANIALIWTMRAGIEQLKSKRWIMMPVCSDHHGPAIAHYVQTDQVEDRSVNSVLGRVLGNGH